MAVTGFHEPGDIFEALFQSIQGGEKHVRPLLDLLPDSHFFSFIEIGYALRACLRDPARRDYLLQRLIRHLMLPLPRRLSPPPPAPPGWPCCRSPSARSRW